MRIRRLPRVSGSCAAALIAGLQGASCGDTAAPTPPTAIDLEPTNLALFLGARQQLQVAVRDAAGNPVTGHTIAWHSADTLVAMVSPTGEVHAVGVGNAVIRATIAAVEAAVQVTVAPQTCALPGGTIHSGRVSGVNAWRGRDGPHHLADTVVVAGQLTVEAGTAVCGAAGAALVINDGSACVGLPSGAFLRAEGRAEAPVLLSAAEQARWGGIVASPSCTYSSVALMHTILEDARVGVRLGHLALGSIANSVIRRVDDEAAQGSLSLRDVLVDAACTAHTPAPGGTPVCAAVYGAFGASSLVLVNTVIRNSGDAGLVPFPRTSLSLTDVRIEGSRGIGLFMADQSFTPSVISRADGEILITGGHTYPAALNHQAAGVLLATRQSRDRLTGNAADTVIILGVLSGPAGYPPVGSSALARVEVGPELAWRFGCEWSCSRVESVTLLPGARLRVDGTLWVDRLDVQGTPADPAVILGRGRIRNLGPAPDTSTISHARIHDVLIEPGRHSPTDPLPSRPLVMRHVHATGSTIVATTGSRLAQVTFHGAFGTFAAFADTSRVPWPIRIAQRGVALTECTVTGSPEEGIRVEVADDVVVRDCNIHGNAGPGLRNTADAPVDARDNWWGDPAGPLGPNGDGVMGNVLFTPFRTTPVDGVAGTWALQSLSRHSPAPATPRPR